MVPPIKQLTLFPYYLNARRLELMGSADLSDAHTTPLFRNSDRRVASMRRAQQLAQNLLQGGALTKLSAESDLSSLDGQRFLGYTWDVCTFSGVGRAFSKAQALKPGATGTLTGQWTIGARTYKISGALAPEHLYSDSSIQVLAGSKRMLVAGMFEKTDDQLNIEPYIIGELIEDVGLLPVGFGAGVRLYPGAIDAFRSGFEHTPPPTRSDLEALLKVPEVEIKHMLAAIIGEPFIPKDWAGEKSDLYSSRLTISGEPISAAFLLKGPSVQGEMHPANLGKRGDQLIRAFDEPAELIVIQHCGKIATSVIRQAEALAYDSRRPRRYCILDGADTARLLKAHGKL